MGARSASHINEIIIEGVQVAVSFLLNVSLMMRRSNEVMRMLHGQCGGLLMRVVDGWEVEALGGTEIVLMMLMGAHWPVSMMQAHLVLLLLLLHVRMAHG